MALCRLPSDPFNRPERFLIPPGPLERPWNWCRSRLSLPNVFHVNALRMEVARIRRLGSQLVSLSDEELQKQCDELRHMLLRSGLSRSLTLRCFAVVSEITCRELGLRHHDVQLMGGLAMLRGNLAEMQTGEGKTLTACLPASVAALNGIPVHVITVNDYLASRDAELMSPLYQRLGLKVSFVVHGMHHAERKEAYAADIVYCTNKELVFDYLRDKQELAKIEHPMMAHSARLRKVLDGRRLLLRGLHFAIVDEADSVLLDEARTPLVLSGPSTGDDIDIHVIDEALGVAKSYIEGLDYVRERESIHLTARGKEKLEDNATWFLESSSVGWLGRSRREWLIQQALIACHHFRRDQHYIVKEGKVQIIDEQTGRTMPDRSWQKGLHQMIERLEGCEPSDSNDTLSRLTYQRFFRRYYHLCGMTGTASEVRSEVWMTYRLKVVSIPPNRPSSRKYYPSVVQTDSLERARWILQRVRSFTAKGRPVLVTTVTLADAESLSAELDSFGIDHRVLSARQDANEADVIAVAGLRGSVTIATSMAGRGTDIALDVDARTAGGLHVIIAGRHDSSRVERQIAGRCARQGDPGSVEIVVVSDEPILGELEGIAFHVGSHSSRLRRAQKRRERRFERDRAKLLAADWKESELLGFSGRVE